MRFERVTGVFGILVFCHLCWGDPWEILARCRLVEVSAKALGGGGGVANTGWYIMCIFIASIPIISELTDGICRAH